MKANQIYHQILYLLEGIQNTSTYYKTEIPILNYFQEKKDTSYIKKHNDPNIYRLVFEKNFLSDYKTNLKYIAYDPDWNYIYHMNQRIEIYKIFEPEDISYLISKNIFLDSAKGKKIDVDSLTSQYLNWNKIIEFGIIGFNSKHGMYVYFTEDHAETFLSKLSLVDGNAKRYNTGIEQNNIEIPDMILTDIVAYTLHARETLSEKTKDWLRNNFKKTYKEITLYRGFGITIDDLYDEKLDQESFSSSYEDDFSDDSNTKYSSGDSYEEDISVYTLMDILQRYVGIDEPEQFRKGTKVKVNRMKESSWSTKPEIAASFSHNGYRDFNMMVKATVPASWVLIDFNLLPKKLLHDKFRYWSQNEVILDNIEIPAVITNTWISDEARSWLVNLDYDFSPTRGIIEYGF